MGEITAFLVFTHREARYPLSQGKEFVSMRVVDVLEISFPDFDCPYCGGLQEGFIGDPRGEEYECEQCGKKYKIDEDPRIKFY